MRCPTCPMKSTRSRTWSYSTCPPFTMSCVDHHLVSDLLLCIITTDKQTFHSVPSYFSLIMQLLFILWLASIDSSGHFLAPFLFSSFFFFFFFLFLQFSRFPLHKVIEMDIVVVVLCKKLIYIYILTDNRATIYFIIITILFEYQRGDDGQERA